MGRKRKNFAQEPETIKPAETPAADPSNRFVISFPLDESSEQQFRELLKNPDIAKLLPTNASDVIRPEWCGNLYDGIGKLLVLAAVKMKGIPSEIASEAFSFNDAEKKMLVDPTSRVLNKYATDWMIRFQDEIGLCFLIVTIINAKIQLCNALVASARSQMPEPIPITKAQPN